MARKWAKIMPGGLHGWKKTKSVLTRHSILNKIVRKDSYATVIRRLNQLRNIAKDSATKRALQHDMSYLKKKHINN